MSAYDEHPRRGRRPQSLHWWLRGNRGQLSRIAQQARTSAQLQRQLQAVLPRQLAGHWRVAKLDDQTLCLVTEDPLWATQLRYRRNVLLRCAERLLGKQPRKFQIRIEPSVGTAQPRPPSRLSATAAETLRHSAQCMEEGPLRAALLRLASRHHET